MATMFKKPKRNFRRKVVTDSDSDQENENKFAEVDNEDNGNYMDIDDDCPDILRAPPPLPPPPPPIPELKKVKKKKRDKEVDPSKVKPLSFDTEEDGDTEVFKVKKSSHSKRIAKQLKKESLKEKEENPDSPKKEEKEIKEEPQEIAEEKLKKLREEIRTLNGDEDEDEDSDEDGKMVFRSMLAIATTADEQNPEVDEDMLMQLGTGQTEVKEWAPGMKYIKYIPNMDCPVCPDSKTFPSRREFEEHWMQTHHRVHKSFTCPIQKCSEARSSLKCLKYHIAHKHLNSHVITANVDKLCTSVTVTEERNENFVDPGNRCLSWQTWRPRGKRGGRKKRSVNASTSGSTMSVPKTETVPENEHETPCASVPHSSASSNMSSLSDLQTESVPSSCASSDMSSISNLQTENAALKERITVLQQALATRHNAHWPTYQDIPAGGPQLDRFIATGWEAMAVLQSAEGRRFQQQFGQSGGAGASIQAMAHGTGN